MVWFFNFTTSLLIPKSSQCVSSSGVNTHNNILESVAIVPAQKCPPPLSQVPVGHILIYIRLLKSSID